MFTRRLSSEDFVLPTQYFFPARTNHASFLKRSKNVRNMPPSSIQTRLGESSVVLLAVEGWEGKEKMMIATAVIIMFNIRYPYIKKANQIQ